jgi:TetR/AcrR family transcriptional repressor of nem operon
MDGTPGWALTEALPTRERLVRTAARLFVTRGYEAVGVNEICAEADVRKGSFYHFFPTKNDLALAAVDHLEADLCAALDAREREVRGPVNKLRATADVVEEIQERLFRTYGRVVGCPIGNLANELAAVQASAGPHVAGVLRRWEHRVAGHFRDAAEVGLLRPGADPDDLARLLIATMQGMVLLAKVSDVPVAAVPAAIRGVIDSSLKKGRAA